MNELLSYGQIILRALEPEDLDLLYTWENDTSLWHVSDSHVPFSRHLLAQYLQNVSRDVYEQKQVRFIIQNTELRPLGAIDLFDFDPYHQRAGIGILIHREEDRRLGYALDALCVLENYATHALGIRQLYAGVSEDNTASINLFDKAGYRVTGIKKQWRRSSEEWKDEWFFQKIFGTNSQIHL